MPHADDARHRVELLRDQVTTRQLLGIGLAIGLAAALATVQEPLVHDALHNFRHVTGIACH
ncbi:MAG: CbtB domain-containing protein [Salinirussus sp.]